MTRDELEIRLAEIGVHPNSYSIGVMRHSDCVCIVPTAGKWKVFYVERNKPVELGMRDTSEQAFDVVYQTFCKWLGITSN